MKPRSLILFLLPVAACTGTSAPPSPSPSPVTAASVAPAPSPSPATFSVEADVVMIDTAAPSVTLRPGDAPASKAPKASDIKKEDRTLKVDAPAESLSGLKAGDHVRVTCREMVAAMDQAISASPGGVASAPPPSPAVAASPASPTATLLGRCEAIVGIAKAEGASLASPAPPPAR
jgi:hypothetical protein